MTDKDARRVQGKVQKHIDKWVDILGLYGWRITCHWYRGAIPDYPESTAIAQDIQWEYLHGRMRFDLTKMEDLEADPRYFERVVLHELLHFVVNEMRDCTDNEGNFHIKHEERVVQTLTLAFMRLKEGK